MTLPPLTGDQHGRSHSHADHDSLRARTSCVNDPDTSRAEHMLWWTGTDGHGCLLRARRGGEIDGRQRMRLRLRSGAEDDAQDTVLRVISAAFQ